MSKHNGCSTSFLCPKSNLEYQSIFENVVSSIHPAEPQMSLFETTA